MQVEPRLLEVELADLLRAYWSQLEKYTMLTIMYDGLQVGDLKFIARSVGDRAE